MQVIYEGALDPRSHGGASVHFKELAGALARTARTEVMVPAFDGCDVDWGFSPHVAVRSLAVPKKSVLALLVYEMRKSAWLVRQRRLRGPETTVFLTRLGVFGLATLLAALLGYRVVVEVNGWPPDEFAARGLPRWMRLVVRVQCELQVRWASGLVCVTPGIAGRAKRGDVPILVLPNGVDTSPYREQIPGQRRTDQSPADTISVVFAGALVAWQDLTTAIEALRQDVKRSWRLIVVGAGEDEEALRALAARSEVADRIDWLGWLPRAKLPDTLSHYDVGLVPLKPKGASDVCGSPLKLFEYLAAGLPVVATVVDGVSELAAELPIEVYDVGDAHGLNSAVARAARRPPLARHELATLRDSIDWTHRSAELLRFIEVA